MSALKKYLQQYPHYMPSVYEKARPHLSTIQLKPGEYFLQHGKISRTIGFIEEGLLRMFYLHDGKEVTNCFCKENTITCSYRSLITRQESDFAIQAIEDSTLTVFSYDSLQELYEKDLFWQQVGRIAAENEFINTECHNRFLTDLSATERYLQLMDQESDLFQRVALNHIASYLQVSPETLSRIRKKISRT